jgi:hypothetical protein
MPETVLAFSITSCFNMSLTLSARIVLKNATYNKTALDSNKNVAHFLKRLMEKSCPNIQ